MHDSAIGKTSDYAPRAVETSGIRGDNAHRILLPCLVSHGVRYKIRGAIRGLYAELCRWGTYTYYLVLVAQQVLGLSALRIGTQLIPFCVWGKLDLMEHRIAG